VSSTPRRFGRLAHFILLARDEAIDVASATAAAAQILRGHGYIAEAIELENAQDLIEDKLANPPPASN